MVICYFRFVITEAFEEKHRKKSAIQMRCCFSGKFHRAVKWWLRHASTLYICVTRHLIIFRVFFPSLNWTCLRFCRTSARICCVLHHIPIFGRTGKNFSLLSQGYQKMKRNKIEAESLSIDRHLVLCQIIFFDVQLIIPPF